MIRRALSLLVPLFAGLLAATGPARPAAAAPSADASTVLIAIDSPAAGSATGGTLVIRGWAADPASVAGTGVDRVEVYVDGEAGAGGTYLGAASYGATRPDVVAHLGAGRFMNSGFTLPATLGAGPHTLYVYAHPSGAPENQQWSAPLTLAVLAAPAGPTLAASPVGPVVAAGSPSAAPPAPRCSGVPNPWGAYPVETPQSYGAIYPYDMPFVFGDPAFWATYGNPNGVAYIDFRSGTVYPNSYFYQPRPARGIPLACAP